MDQAFFTDKKVVVMGLGRFGGGVDSALFAAKAGADVLVTDLAGQEQLSDSLAALVAILVARESLRRLSRRFSQGAAADERQARPLEAAPRVWASPPVAWATSSRHELIHFGAGAGG